jgi:hypothetical protein
MTKARLLVLLPALVILFLALPQLLYLLPSPHDTLTESAEPARTFQFVATRGRYVHKWGQVPSLFYAPAYALVLARTPGHRASDIGRMYTLDFDNPALMTPLIVAGRTVVLIVSLIATFVLSASLARNTGDARVALVILACLSTSAVFFEPWTDTKPDGMMDALLMISLAAYASIVFRGLTLARALVMTLFYVASLSCKELTSLAMVLPFLWFAGGALRKLRRNPAEQAGEGRRELRILFASLLAAGVFYFLFNIAWSFPAWMDRMRIVFGPLKNPAIWAPPQQTTWSYLLGILRISGGAVGPGGLAALAIALAGTVIRPSARLFALWLPFLSHFLLTTLTAGTPTFYYMMPLAPALCLPAGAVVADWLKTHRVSPAAGAVATAVIVLACGYLGLNSITLFRQGHNDTLMRRSYYEAVRPGSLVNEWFLWQRGGNPQALLPGPNDTRIDQEPAYELPLDAKDKLPDYILVNSGMEWFMRDTRQRPARAEMLRLETGYDYRNFPSFAELGYEKISETVPQYPRWVVPWLDLNRKEYTSVVIQVFRRTSTR